MLNPVGPPSKLSNLEVVLGLPETHTESYLSKMYTYHLTRQCALGGKSLFIHSKSCIDCGITSTKTLDNEKS